MKKIYTLLLICVLAVNSSFSQLYWIGGSGTWNDTEHWSNQSGGHPANRLPSASEQVFFDEESFLQASEILLTESPTVSSMIWNSSDVLTFTGAYQINLSDVEVLHQSTFSSISSKLNYVFQMLRLVIIQYRQHLPM